MKKITLTFLSLVLAVSLVACGANNSSSSSSSSTSSEISSSSSSQSSSMSSPLPTVDPSGATIKVPETINTIGVLAPSLAEIVVDLGEASKVVARDVHSEPVKGLPSGILALDFVNPNMEQLLALKPDVLFVTSMTLYDGTNPYKKLIDAGVSVIVVPTSDSIQGIKDSIIFMSQVLRKEEQGKKIVEAMQKEIDRITEIGKTIKDKKKVYFEIDTATKLYTFGSNVYLNEMIEIIGAENIFANQKGWISVDPETVVAANPDVILTNISYIPDITKTILTRSGWGNVNAIKNKQVFYIDNFASSRPSHYIVKALNEIAKAIYPEVYK